MFYSLLEKNFLYREHWNILDEDLDIIQVQILFTKIKYRWLTRHFLKNFWLKCSHIQKAPLLRRVGGFASIRIRKKGLIMNIKGPRRYGLFLALILIDEYVNSKGRIKVKYNKVYYDYLSITTFVNRLNWINNEIEIEFENEEDIATETMTGYYLISPHIAHWYYYRRSVRGAKHYVNLITNGEA